MDWNEGELPLIQPMVSIARAAPGMPHFRAATGGRPMAYDSQSDSHWCVSYRDASDRLYAVRCGYTGRVVEQVTVYDHPTHRARPPAVAFNGVVSGFAIAHGTNEPTSWFRMQLLVPSPSAGVIKYGIPCPGTVVAANRGPDVPYAGSEFFRISLLGGIANAPTILIASLLPANVPIPGSACSLYIDPVGAVLMAGGMADGMGRLQVPVPLPDLFTVGDIRWQFLQIDGSGFWRGSDGAYTVIR